jgi:nucleoside recognition membrane protein YjiH
VKIFVMYAAVTLNAVIFSLALVAWNQPPLPILIPPLIGIVAALLAIRTGRDSARKPVALLAGVLAILATLAEMAVVTFLLLIGPLVG